VRVELIESLRRGEVNPKFLYETPGQARRWLALHEACSPARTERACAEAYERAFRDIAERAGSVRAEVVGLGCGGGQKDARLVQLLCEAGAEVAYTPVDVSPTLVLTAGQAVRAVAPAVLRPGIVCDLGEVACLHTLVEEARRSCGGQPPRAENGPMVRITTFFGMVPNFEPGKVVGILNSLVRKSGDLLVLSANLAPGPDYVRGVQEVLPLYDNTLTREWLIGFLTEASIDESAGELQFAIEEDPATRLRRITAWFTFDKPARAVVDSEVVPFAAGTRLKVFFSYRHTPKLMADLLRPAGLKMDGEWVAPSGEEGVFLLR